MTLKSCPDVDGLLMGCYFDGLLMESYVDGLLMVCYDFQIQLISFSDFGLNSCQLLALVFSA